MNNIDNLDGAAIDSAAENFTDLTAQERIRRALHRFGDRLVLNSSFGPQSIVCLKLALDVDPRIPVVMLELPGAEYDTQRLYRDYLKALLGFDLYIVQVRDMSQKKTALCEFLQAHGARASLSGIRRQQTGNRAQKDMLEYDADFPRILKIYPIADWPDLRTWEFIERLPAELRHPNYARGLRSVGGALLDAGQTKFECGLHL